MSASSSESKVAVAAVYGWPLVALLWPLWQFISVLTDDREGGAFRGFGIIGQFVISAAQALVILLLWALWAYFIRRRRKMKQQQAEPHAPPFHPPPPR